MLVALNSTLTSVSDVPLTEKAIPVVELFVPGATTLTVSLDFTDMFVAFDVGVLPLSTLK